MTALMRARWENAWGKFPRCRPVCGSISSAYSSSLHAIAQHEFVFGELVSDGKHRGSYPLVAGRQETYQRDQQDGGVQGGGVVVLAEHAALVDAVRADLGVDLIGGAPPVGG